MQRFCGKSQTVLKYSFLSRTKMLMFFFNKVFVVTKNGFKIRRMKFSKYGSNTIISDAPSERINHHFHLLPALTLVCITWPLTWLPVGCPVWLSAQSLLKVLTLFGTHPTNRTEVRGDTRMRVGGSRLFSEGFLGHVVSPPVNKTKRGSEADF